MRQVFSSHRLENVEAVAKLLGDEGIEVRITDGRSFQRSSIRGSSYRASANKGPTPAVWVVRSDDQPRARQMLREVGLLDDSTASRNSYLPMAPHAMRDRDLQQSKKRTNRIRLGLLALVAIFTAAIVFKPKPSTDTMPVAQRPATGTAGPVELAPHLQQVATSTETRYRIATPPALAAAVAAREQARLGGMLCLAIDGDDAADTALDMLRTRGIDVRPLSACSDDAQALRIHVDAWDTDGSGSGSVGWTSARGEEAAVQSSSEAHRDGDHWRIED